MLIALISGLAALGAAVVGLREGLKGRVRHDRNSIGWVLSTLLLVIPVIAMMILASGCFTGMPVTPFVIF